MKLVMGKNVNIEVDIRRCLVVEFLLRPFLANTKSVKALFTSSLEYLVIGLALSSLSAVNSIMKGTPRKQQNPFVSSFRFCIEISLLISHSHSLMAVNCFVVFFPEKAT